MLSARSLFALTPLLWALLAACSKEPSPQAVPAGSARPAAPKSSPEPLEGQPAPEVTLTLEDGSSRALSSLRGTAVALYFYPKDETPGCTIEAQEMRDLHDEVTKAGVTVLGVSTQDAASHRAFIEKERLPFHLVADTSGEVARAFGVALTLGFASRDTVLIGPDGVVRKVFRKVSPKGHAAEVLRAVRS